MVHDIQSVNAFVAAGLANPNIRAVDVNSTDIDCVSVDSDYVEYVSSTNVRAIVLNHALVNRGSSVPNQPAGAFWAVLNRLLIIFQVIVLIMSEVGWPAAFFNRFFPILGDSFGLGALGVIQCLWVYFHCCDDPFAGTQIP